MKQVEEKEQTIPTFSPGGRELETEAAVSNAHTIPIINNEGVEEKGQGMPMFSPGDSDSEKEILVTNDHTIHIIEMKELGEKGEIISASSSGNSEFEAGVAGTSTHTIPIIEMEEVEEKAVMNAHTIHIIKITEVEEKTQTMTTCSPGDIELETGAAVTNAHKIPIVEERNYNNGITIRDNNLPCIDTIMKRKRKSLTYFDALKKTEVQMANNNQQRVWDKRHSCPYCHNMYAKLARHMEQMHSGELEVAATLALPKHSKERKKQWDQIRNRGNFNHNLKVINSEQGAIIPLRRPSSKARRDEYLPCTKCLGFASKKHLRKHTRTCKSYRSGTETGTEITTAKPHHYIQGSMALLPCGPADSSCFKNDIINRMAHDQVSLIVRNDPLILMYGMKLYQTHSKHPHQHQYVKQKLRELGRLLQAAREENSSIKRMEDCIDSVNFKSVVNAAKHISGYDETTKDFKTPSLAVHLGTSLKVCAGCVLSSALQTKDNLKEKEANRFIKLCTLNWASEISGQATRSLDDSKYNKPKRIPVANDIKCLNEYLKHEAQRLTDDLREMKSDKTWRQLAEVTLVQVTLFNRKRSGEMSRMKLSEYKNGMKTSLDAGREVQETLSSFEKHLLHAISRFEIRGKRGRKVAVLVTTQYKHQIELLNGTRSVGRIDPNNNYLFPRPGSSRTPLACSELLRRYSKICGAKEPIMLTSTNLRKHLGVTSQLLNLKKNELDLLATFMGHDIRIHRQYYRLPEDTLELVKVSKILLNLEEGKLQNFHGKSLEELEVEVDGKFSINGKYR